MSQNKIVIVLPGFNCERTLENVYNAIPKQLRNWVLLVDDGSTDNTASVSRKLKVKTIIHPRNLGYGANQKTCFKAALKMGADFVIMLHPDGQYDPLDLIKFTKALTKKKGDLVLGSRFLKKERMETPFYKIISLKFITTLFNLVLGTKLTEVNTGYRGFSRKLLETVPFIKNGNGYIFDPQMIIQAKYFGFKITEVPVIKVYNQEASSPGFKKSVGHGIENLSLLVQFIPHKLNLKKADFLTTD